MMVGILIHIESLKHVIGVVQFHTVGNRMSTVDWNKVHSAIDSVDVYYFETRCVVGKVAGSDDPHPCVIIRRVICLFKQMDDGTRI